MFMLGYKFHFLWFVPVVFVSTMLALVFIITGSIVPTGKYMYSNQTNKLRCLFFMNVNINPKACTILKQYLMR